MHLASLFSGALQIQYFFLRLFVRRSIFTLLFPLSIPSFPPLSSVHCVFYDDSRAAAFRPFWVRTRPRPFGRSVFEVCILTPTFLHCAFDPKPTDRYLSPSPPLDFSNVFSWYICRIASQLRGLVSSPSSLSFVSLISYFLSTLVGHG